MIDYGVTISVPFRFGVEQGDLDGGSLRPGTGGALAQNTDERSIWKDRVFIVMLTSVKERAMRPLYGTRVLDSLFDDESSAISNCYSSISAAFTQWLPDLSLKTLDVAYDSDTGQLNINVEYILPSGAIDIASARIDSIRTDTFDRYGKIIREGA